MARQDTNKGFGNLPPWLTSWYCPECKKDATIEKWEVKIVPVGPDDLQGRKCPNCDFVASQTGDTERMLQQDKNSVEVIKVRMMNEKQKEEYEQEKLKLSKKDG